MLKIFSSTVKYLKLIIKTTFLFKTFKRPKVSIDVQLIVYLPIYSLVAETSTGCFLGGSALGKRDENPEETGRRAAQELLDPMKQGSCVDRHSQDQVIIFMALAEGLSRIRMGELTLHTKTAIYITEHLTNVGIVNYETSECLCDYF